jgi:hypothetical protein
VPEGGSSHTTAITIGSNTSAVMRRDKVYVTGGRDRNLCDVIAP